jgi:hypothetical protein
MLKSKCKQLGSKCDHHVKEEHATWEKYLPWHQTPSDLSEADLFVRGFWMSKCLEWSEVSVGDYHSTRKDIGRDSWGTFLSGRLRVVVARNSAGGACALLLTQKKLCSEARIPGVFQPICSQVPNSNNFPKVSANAADRASAAFNLHSCQVGEATEPDPSSHSPSLPGCISCIMKILKRASASM